MNGTKGGEGCVPTCETREKMRQASLGRKFSPATREKLSEAMKKKNGGTLTPEHKAAISRALSGKTLSLVTRKKISDARKKLAQQKKDAKVTSSVG